MTSRTLNGWLIHSQISGETSLYLSLFTEEQGLLKISYPGGQSRKKKSSLHLFTPLWIELQQRGPRQYCQSIEIKSPPPILNGLPLCCAYYINELLYKTLKQPEADSQVYTVYEQTLQDLKQTSKSSEIERILRQFEWTLLVSQGHTYTFQYEGDQQTKIDGSLYYQFKAGYGFYINPQGFPGSTLISIASHGLINKANLQVAKQIMRQAIDHLVDYQPIHARKLYASTSAQ